MTIPRFLGVLALLLLIQGTVFALYYEDLLYLRHPLSDIVAGSRETFERHATDALRRERLTRQHLDTMAEAAKSFELTAIEIRALDRRAREDMSDRRVRLRLADALRRSGDFMRAEAIYLDLLSAREPEVSR